MLAPEIDNQLRNAADLAPKLSAMVNPRIQYVALIVNFCCTKITTSKMPKEIENPIT